MKTVEQAENELSDAMDALIYARRDVSDAHTRLDYAFLMLRSADDSNSEQRSFAVYEGIRNLKICTEHMERNLIQYNVAQNTLNLARSLA